MKYKCIVVLLTAFTVVLFSSCKKEDNVLRDTIAASLEKIQGQYKISSMEWLGEPLGIDLDGDGQASADLFAEFDQLAIRHYTEKDKESANIYYGTSYVAAPDVVSNIKSDRQSSFYISLPLQYVELDKMEAGGYCISLIDRRQYIDIDFYIEDNGSYRFNDFEKIENPYDENLLDLCALSNGNLSYIAPGELQLDITYLFYDYVTKSTVTGPVRIKFKRFSLK